MISALTITAGVMGRHDFYDSVVVFEKGRHTAKQAPQIGLPAPRD